MTASPDIYRIGTIGKGSLAIAAQPASAGDLSGRIDEIAANGFNRVVSLLEPAEAESLGLQQESDLLRARGLEYLSFPIPDMGLPPSVVAFTRLSRRLFQEIQAGSHTLIHCRAGVGRSGLLAAAIMIQGGRDASRACALVARQRGMRIPETPAQGAWLENNLSAPCACS